eukprot:TRINITY_DN14420_c0_g1_i2.p1 TRINITY_DN14420_c0_g1~~TRINITY_DN14420_c0_g1_i2.p1  ORF type:complete len:307 (-),score=94.00 TRINITY_DN14420_c0_g1_i2:136-1056(-)
MVGAEERPASEASTCTPSSGAPTPDPKAASLALSAGAEVAGGSSGSRQGAKVQTACARRCAAEVDDAVVVGVLKSLQVLNQRLHASSAVGSQARNVEPMEAARAVEDVNAIPLSGAALSNKLPALRDPLGRLDQLEECLKRTEALQSKLVEAANRDEEDQAEQERLKEAERAASTAWMRAELECAWTELQAGWEKKQERARGDDDVVFRSLRREFEDMKLQNQVARIDVERLQTEQAATQKRCAELEEQVQTLREKEERRKQQRNKASDASPKSRNGKAKPSSWFSCCSVSRSVDKQDAKDLGAKY